MKRSLGIFAIGIAMGVAIGFAIFGRGKKAPDLTSPGYNERNERGTTVSSSPSQIDFRNGRILLGKIDTVPFQELYGLLSQQTPAEIRQLAQQLDSLPAGRETTGKIDAFFKAWAHLAPAAAFKAASELKTIEARDTAISATLNGADQSASGLLAHSLVDLPEGVLSTMSKAGLLGMILGRWSDTDAPAAAKFFDQNPQSGMSFTLASDAIAQNWAATDPASAIAWANEHPGGPMGGSALSGAISGWWQKDHAAAEAYALAHANDPNAMHFMAGLINQMARDNPQHAVAWVNQLPDAAVRKQSESMLAMTWSTYDPRAASQWAASLPNEQSASALSSSMSFWAQTDPQAASQWLETLNGTTRDNAIGAFSSGLISKDPAAALKWVESIGDAIIRDRTLKQVVGQWRVLDPIAARTWIQNSSLSEADKAQLLGSVPGG